MSTIRHTFTSFDGLLCEADVTERATLWSGAQAWTSYCSELGIVPSAPSEGTMDADDSSFVFRTNINFNPQHFIDRITDNIFNYSSEAGFGLYRSTEYLGNVGGISSTAVNAKLSNSTTPVTRMFASSPQLPRLFFTFHDNADLRSESTKFVSNLNGAVIYAEHRAYNTNTANRYVVVIQITKKSIKFHFSNRDFVSGQSINVPFFAFTFNSVTTSSSTVLDRKVISNNVFSGNNASSEFLFNFELKKSLGKINVSNQIKDIVEGYFKVNGTWRPIKSGLAKDNVSWHNMSGGIGERELFINANFLKVANSPTTDDLYFTLNHLSLGNPQGTEYRYLRSGTTLVLNWTTNPPQSHYLTNYPTISEFSYTMTVEARFGERFASKSFTYSFHGVGGSGSGSGSGGVQSIGVENI